ncbi:hypothetical protein BH11ARM2_BH11ARM2_26460 [soil metagenome]
MFSVMCVRWPTSLLLLSTLVAVAPASTTFTCYGWQIANIVGPTSSQGGSSTQYVKANGDQLPTPWAAAVDGNGLVVTTGVTALIYNNGSGVAFKNTAGIVYGTWKVKMDGAPPLGGKVRIKFTYTAEATITGQTHKNGATAFSGARASNKSGNAIISRSISGITQQYDEGKGPKTFSWAPTFTCSWANEGNNQYSANFTTDAPGLSDKSTVSTPTSPGILSISSTATATSTGKIYPKSAKYVDGSITSSLPADAYPGTVLIDLPSALGVPLENWGVERENGAIHFPHDEYADGTFQMFVSARGSLRKKVTASVVNGIASYDRDAGLLYGDLDGDNYVSQAEVNWVYAMIGANNSGNWQWDLPDSGQTYCLGEADFNGDGAITTGDYLLAASNVGVTGDQ